MDVTPTTNTQGAAAAPQFPGCRNCMDGVLRPFGFCFEGPVRCVKNIAWTVIDATCNFLANIAARINQLFYNILWCFSRRVCNHRFSYGNFNQSSIFSNGMLRCPPGGIACNVIATEAVSRYLRGGMRNPQDINSALIEGVAKGLNLRGAGLPVNLTERYHWRVARSEIQNRINQLPASRTRLGDFTHWDDIRGQFPGMVDPVHEAGNFSEANFARAEGLQFDRANPDRFGVLVNAIFSLSNFAPNGGYAGGTINISSFSTYAIGLHKNDRGQIDEVFFFDSHSNAKGFGAAYFERYTQSDGQNAVFKAAAVLSRRFPAGRHASIQPLCLR